MSDGICTDGHVFTGWPPRPVFSLYDWDGTLLHRVRAANFDLADAVRFNHLDLGSFVRLGLSSESSIRRRWTADELLRQEENIRYDLTEDGYSVAINRIKGKGLLQREELLWELHIH